jgi:type I restriction enzyme S subunit
VQHIDREGDKVIKWDLITDDAVKKYKLKIYPKGTIVFPKSGASIYLEKRAMLPIDAYIVSHLCAVISNDKNVNQKFLFYELRNIELSKDKTDGYPTLNLSEVKNVKVIIPYLLEQQKIAFVLSKIQQSIEQQDKIIQITKELKKSLMNKLFTEGLHGEEQKESEISLIPKTWNIKRLGEIATLQRGKDLPKYEFKEGNIPVIGSNGCIGYHNKAIKQGPGVITGRSGSIGKITYIEGSYWPHNTALYVKDFHDNEPLFVYYLLHRLDFNKYKTGVSVPTLNRNFIHAALLPVPPKKEQVEIANVLFSIDKKLTQVESRKQTLQALFRTMLNQLMTGKVRVKDLDFEVKENV